MMNQDFNETYFHEGPTFKIRETRDDDLNIWYQWFNDPKVTCSMVHGLVPNTIEAQREFRNKHIRGIEKIIFSIESLDSKKLIGTCSINFTNPASVRRAELSLVIGEGEYRIGPIYFGVTVWQLDHAFFELNMNSVFAATHINNIAVQATLERLGFKKCGVMRDTSFKNGKYWDTVWYDILASEWMSKRPSKG